MNSTEIPDVVGSTSSPSLPPLSEILNPLKKYRDIFAAITTTQNNNTIYFGNDTTKKQSGYSTAQSYP